MRRKPLFVLVALVILAAGAALLFVQRDPVPAPEVRPSTPPAPPPSIASELPELSAFVENTRGLKFREEVKLTIVSQAQLQQARTAEPARIARTEVVLTILGLLPPETDLAPLVAAAGSWGGARYDPASGELFAVNEPTPQVRRALVHELARTLDDQNFEIDRPISGEDAAAAFEALVEGSAARVERAHIETLPPAEQQELAAGEQAVDPALEPLVAFPQKYGPPFVAALLKEGPERLNQAFESPPVSTEQVIDPAGYFSADTPQAVKRPHTEGPVIDEGDFGPVLLRLLLESKLDAPAAAEAAAGWDGDRYATWRSPDGRTCIRVAFAADSPEDSRQLQTALAQWVDRVTDREVDSAGLLLKACERRVPLP